jgi:hypothetical protein
LFHLTDELGRWQRRDLNEARPWFKKSVKFRKIHRNSAILGGSKF